MFTAAGGILLGRLGAGRGGPLGLGARESGHWLSLSTPQHLALHLLLSEGSGGMHFLVPLP